MTDQESRDMILTAIAEIKEQDKEHYERLEKRLDAMEAQRKEDNERLEKHLESIAVQAKEDNERLEKRLDSLDTRVGGLERDVGWIKGKLEGKQEVYSRALNFFTIGASIAAVIIALIAIVGS